MKIIHLTLIFCLVASISAAQEKVKAVHVFVALCDNDSQGIVPVPKKLGDGNNPNNNLYWGALYGVKTFFEKDSDWTLVRTVEEGSDNVLERCLFRHRTGTIYLVADAYRGFKIKRAVEDFFAAAAGTGSQTLKLNQRHVRIQGRADLVIYVGHNGLMDFEVKKPEREKGSSPNDVMVLACKSKLYFHDWLSELGCKSVLLTTGFMAPEAYTLDAVVDGWIAGETGERIRNRAARAYNKYQKCGMKGATRLFYCE